MSHTEDIYFNLATEEYLLKEFTSNCFMLWQSQTSIVVGKHQNALAEINQAFVMKNNIPVARRLTGGGTVYHGKGNLNFTFIRNGQPGKLVDFKYFVSPVVHYLKELGIQATIGEKNDILVDGLKISGNAEHVFRNRVLHHGTLLFDADLNQLNESIEVQAGKYRDKAVQSNRSAVTNITTHLMQAMSMEQFRQGLLTYLLDRFPGAEMYELSAEDKMKIQDLQNEKYATDEWIYGYSPDFEVESSLRYEGKEYPVHCRIKRGKLLSIETALETRELEERIREVLVGISFDYGIVGQVLKAEEIIPREIRESMLKALFH